MIKICNDRSCEIFAIRLKSPWLNESGRVDGTGFRRISNLCRYVPIILVAAIGILFSIGAFAFINGLEFKRAEDSFHRQASDRIITVQEPINSELTVIVFSAKDSPAEMAEGIETVLLKYRSTNDVLLDAMRFAAG